MNTCVIHLLVLPPPYIPKRTPPPPMYAVWTCLILALFSIDVIRYVIIVSACLSVSQLDGCNTTSIHVANVKKVNRHAH